MKAKSLSTLLMLTVFAFLLLNLHIGHASPAAPRTAAYEIAWYTVDAGGGQELTGGSYSLKGTAGQFDAGSQNNGSYALKGGFWFELDLFGYRLSLPLVIR